MSTTQPPRSAPTDGALTLPGYWRMPLAVFVAVVAWLLVLYRDAVVGMVSIWERSDTYAHGFLVPPIVLWLVWRRRGQLAHMMPRPSATAVLLMSGVAALWLMGDLVSVNAATQLALVALLVLAVPAVLGWRVAWALLFPLCFLFFAVPIGDFMMPKLMEWTADFTVVALRVSGLPVYREGQQFVIPSGYWSVVEACSGIRYLIASVTVGALFAYLNYQSSLRRALFVLVSILVPILANWLRAYMIVMLGHYSGNTIATGVDHLIYGWVFFGVVILIMFAVGARWSEPAPQHVPEPALVARATPATHSWGGHAVLVALLIVTAAPHALIWALERSQNHAVPQLALADGWQGGWASAPPPAPDWRPAFQNPSAALVAGAGKDGRPIGVYIGYYRAQDAQRKLVSSENLLVRHADQDWAQVKSGARTVALGGLPVVWRTAELRAAQPGSTDATRLAVMQVYWVHDRFVAGDAMAKIHGALGRLAGWGDDSAVLIVYTPASAAGEDEAALSAFLEANGPLIAAGLRRVRQH